MSCLQEQDSEFRQIHQFKRIWELKVDMPEGIGEVLWAVRPKEESPGTGSLSVNL